MIRAAWLALLCSASITATADEPFDIAGSTSIELCRHWRIRDQDPKIRDELTARKELSAADWKDIEEVRLFIGMSELTMVCSLGYFHEVHTFTDARGKHRDYWFGGRNLHVYVENGTVTSWQD